MDVRPGGAIIAHRNGADGNAPLTALDATPFATMFHSWRGASERRYVTSVYEVDVLSEDFGLSAGDAFVLVSVRRHGAANRPLAIVAIERESDRRVAIAEALARGADAWHVHLLAADRRARAHVVADLRARHGMPERTALSA